MSRPPAAVAARGLTAGACGSTFGDDVLSWPDGHPPPERDRCPSCQAAFLQTVHEAEERVRSREQRLRAAYVAGAEESSLKRLGAG
jgi:hypothetical protein